MLENITLLTPEEYTKYKSIIPKIEKPWWLQNNKEPSCNAQAVAKDGLVYHFNIMEVLGIRPVAVGNLPDAFKPGDKIEAWDHSWTVLDYNLMICDSIVHEASFSGTNSNWDTSLVYKWLKYWHSKFPMSTTIYHHPKKTELTPERATELVKNFINFEISDFSELDYALEELHEIGLTDDELKILGYEVFFEDEKEEENDENWGVHISHCCKWHGCKYGDPDCPVKLGKVKQAYLCDYCAEDLEEEKFFVEKLAEIAEMKKFRGG